MKNLITISIALYVCLQFTVSAKISTNHSSKKNETENILTTNFDFAVKQTPYLLKSFNLMLKSELKTGSKLLVSPRNLEANGSLHLVSTKDWCCGFFPGNLWFLYENSNNTYWKSEAEKFSKSLENEKYSTNTHDIGFKMLCSYGNGYRITKNPAYRDILIQSARSLVTRFNPTVGCIRSWDHSTNKWQYPVIIDNMMNLELLFFAFNQTHDSVFYKVAVNHAINTMKNHFRADNSCYHVVDYDCKTGKVIKKMTHQGLNDDSSWARGQAWALYGYVICYRETKNPIFLNQARLVQQFIFNHKNLPADLIPYWDFDVQPTPTTPRDVSAATVTASALYEFSLYDIEKSAEYKLLADNILKNITQNYRSPIGENKGFLLLHSTGTFPKNVEVDVPIIYADYYYLESLTRKKELESKGMITFNSK
jgi:hypothetical protein